MHMHYVSWPTNYNDSQNTLYNMWRPTTLTLLVKVCNLKQFTMNSQSVTKVPHQQNCTNYINCELYRISFREKSTSEIKLNIKYINYHNWTQNDGHCFFIKWSTMYHMYSSSSLPEEGSIVLGSLVKNFLNSLAKASS